MIRKHLSQQQSEQAEHKRWRGRDVSRIESFSDAVFGFAITLLVVSLEVPKTYEDLMATVGGFLPFAVCFGSMMQVWFAHYTYFRRYGLQDMTTIALNAALLFVVLFYTYPLKFVFRLVFDQILGAAHGAPPPSEMTPPQFRMLFVVYGIGFMAVFGILALMYRHAWRRRALFEPPLDEFEVFDAMTSLLSHAQIVVIAALSIIATLLLPSPYIGFAGFVYFLIGPAEGMLKGKRGARRRAMEARTAGRPAP